MLIAILEDEKLLATNIKKKLEKNWYIVNIFNNLKEIEKVNLKYDLYIVDISLPDWSWLDFIKKLREIKKINTPLIITSWYNDTDNKVYWLNIWADDYLAKPFSPDELLARVNAMIRRAYLIKNETLMKYKCFSYNDNDKTIIKKWQKIELTKKESEICKLFLTHQWELIEKDKLVISIWWEYNKNIVTENTINVTLSRLRTKLWNDFNLKTLIWKWYVLD